MIKLIFGEKKKMIKHHGKDYYDLRNTIQSCFPQVPVDYSLSYLDEDQDQICLNSNQDLINMLNMSIKTHKVYIKKSLSQTVVLDLERSDVIEPTVTVVVQVQEAKNKNFTKPAEAEYRFKLEELVREEVHDKVEQQKQEEVHEEVTEINIQKFEDQVQMQKSSSSAKAAVENIPEIKEQKQERKEEIIQEVKEQPPKNEKLLQEVQEASQKEQIQIPINNHLLEGNIDSVDHKKPVMKDAFIQEEPFYFSREIAIQSDFPDIEKKQEPIRMKVDPSRNLVSSIIEKKVQINRSLIYSKVQEIREEKPKKEQNLYVHEVTCARCSDGFGIVGIRYQCIFCDNFNLCSRCQEEIEHDHALVKVRRSEMAIKRVDLIEKFGKKAQDPKPSCVPSGYYVPSIDKKEADHVIDTAKKAYKQGMQRANKLMEDLFFKLEMSHKNPYEKLQKNPYQAEKQPQPVRKIETVYEKAKYLQEIMGVRYEEAINFVTKYPRQNSQRILDLYLQRKG